VFCAAFLLLQFGLVFFWQNSIGAKAASRLLMKLTPVVNFINILGAPFFTMFFQRKITNTNCNYKKLQKQYRIKKSLL